ncbi:polycomb group protein EMBRYONIC FLOWER 2-like isoform X2 [Cicer arietinum]|uniref:polycomb group protein EMBRYONIC FLOWER 2-like isoform X2 n=1 Tax=Cicer arietinum TaxID=3827 RepID=UPI003CC6BAD6
MIQMSILLSRSNEESKNVFPLYIGLARRDPNNEDADYSAVYLVSQIFTFRDPSGIGGNDQIQATFVLHDINKLAVEAKSGSLFLLFFTTEANSNSSSRVNTNPGPSNMTSYESRVENNCLYGKVSFQSIYMAWDCSQNFRWGQRAEIITTVDLLPCILKQYDYQNTSTTISIQDLLNAATVSTPKNVEITIFAEEFGAMETPLDRTHASNDVASSSTSSNIIRMKEGNVTFNYRYYNNKLKKTEVTQNFSCPFCLVKCASYKGLRCHLYASHDHFNFEFLALEDSLSVNVSVKTDTWKTEIVAEGIDPKLQTFSLHADKSKRRSPNNAGIEEVRDVDSQVLANDANPPVLATDVDPPVLANDMDPPFLATEADPLVLAIDADSSVVAIDADLPALALDTGPLFLESETPVGDTELLNKADGTSATISGVAKASIVSNPSPDCVPPISEHDQGTPAALQVGNTGKLPVEHFDPQIVAQLKKRQFYHSHKSQPMSLEEVLSNYDSEDEVDDEVANFEERRKLDLLRVSKHEKQFMFMWNSFIRKQRVRVDAHIRWACKAFSILHGSELVKSRKLSWHWTLFRLKLCNLGLIDAKIMNDCGMILEQFEKQKSDPKIPIANVNSLLLSPLRNRRKR